MFHENLIARISSDFNLSSIKLKNGLEFNLDFIYDWDNPNRELRGWGTSEY